MAKPCICGRTKAFNNCCGRFLVAGQLAKTPEQLMRSRYSAYALGGYGDYLLATWFAATAGSLSAEALSEKTANWVRLEVLDSQQTGDSATVAFNAYFRELNGSELKILHEISVFQRTARRWFYVGGEVTRNPAS
jgi:SEC-C motif domain protein